MGLLFSAIALQGFAQGTGLVNMSNTSGALATTNLNNGVATGNALGLGQYYYALLISSTLPTTNGMGISVGSSGVISASNPTTFGFTATAITGTNSAASTGGRFTGGPATGVQVAGTSAGNTYYYVIAGWSSSLGTSWSQVSSEIAGNAWTANGFYGFSQMGSYVAGGLLADGTTTQPTPQMMSATTVPGFSMYNVSVVATPEPGTMALAALGGASLLLFRRRNK